MRTKTLLVSATLLLTAAAGCLAGDEQTLRDLDAQWSAAAAAKDVDKTISYYSDDATVLAPKTPAVTTKEGIRKLWATLFGSPGMSISWSAPKVEIAKSGDMAYVIGTYEMTLNDAAGKPTKDRGKYLEVFEKGPDGTWRCGADAFDSDGTAAAPSEAK